MRTAILVDPELNPGAVPRFDKFLFLHNSLLISYSYSFLFLLPKRFICCNRQQRRGAQGIADTIRKLTKCGNNLTFPEKTYGMARSCRRRYLWQYGMVDPQGILWHISGAARINIQKIRCFRNNSRSLGAPRGGAWDRRREARVWQKTGTP